MVKRKARLVICGNFQEKQGREDVYATGCLSEALRSVLVWAAAQNWDIGSTDIRNAFLLAPTPQDSMVYVIRAPVVVKDAMALLGCEVAEAYAVDRALCGFRKSPKLWNDFRNTELRKAKIMIAGRTAVLRPLVSDENIWAVVWEDKLQESPDVPIGSLAIALIVVYVDDLLYLGRKYVIRAVHQWVSSRWKCNDLALATSQEPIRFLGLEIYKQESGLRITQEGYVRELVKQHALQDAKTVMTPCPREWLLGPDLGTKCFTIGRLRELVSLWGLRPEEHQLRSLKTSWDKATWALFWSLLARQPATLSATTTRCLCREEPLCRLLSV
ncbi:RE1 [Symbiodinium natans]|uniref:RE1 protein n=1 Tax=Symbiodinium natans TaxID=878477 RepID=A0A812RFW7_9DINO|nr:RE1 [Symbiodinium natans]